MSVALARRFWEMETVEVVIGNASRLALCPDMEQSFVTCRRANDSCLEARKL